MVVPSQSNHILTMPIHQFVSEIKVRLRSQRVCFPNLSILKMPQGWTDGADRYPGPVFLSTNLIECSYAIAQYTACIHPPR
jgi:hypothetical protein